MIIDYSQPIAVDGNPGFFLRKDTVVILSVPYYVHYVAYGPDFNNTEISPFNEHGTPFTDSEVLAFGLEGVAATDPVVNIPAESVDTFYVRKEADGFFPVSSLDEVRSAHQIFGTMPQGVMRVVVSSTNGVWGTVSAGTEVLDLQSVLYNPYFK